jgi:hypothetical protein
MDGGWTMRLTLRTLIAWLDDTLTPVEVRAIGQQVAESPFAKELVERVQRVTRQRRLTYPGDLGSEPADPNLVAGYLDNELAPEQVAEYEKRCLTSDVHLAEVASVHQILSLIGQKAKVPPDAKLRMYRLVRGRETTQESPTGKARPTPAPRKTPAPEPNSGWSSGVPTHRSPFERFGPAAVVLLLIGLMSWAAVHSLRTETPTAVAVNVPARVNEANKPPEPLKNENATVAGPANNAGTEPPVVAEPMPKNEPPAKAANSTPDDVGTFDAIQGVVLRSGAEPGTWERVEAKAPLKERTRLLNLSPFRNALKLGKAEVDLVDSTDVVLDDSEKDQSARLILNRGQILVRSAPTSSPFAVRFEGQILAISAPPGVVVGVERAPTLMAGQSDPAPARLRIFVPEGKAVLRAGEAEETLSGPGEISLQISGKFGEKGRQPMPAWVTESAPSGFSKEVGDQFVALLRPGRPILSVLVEAMDDPQKDVKQMAVHALGSIGAMEQVVEVVSRKEEASVHRAGIEVLRTGLAQGGETAKAVREALIRQYDRPWSDVTEKLLVGFRPEEAKDELTLVKLVEYLAAAPSRGTRQLALDNLRSLTGRDSLEYDPDSPEGKGLKAWQDLVRKKEPTKEARPAGPNNR